jgi:hypothetical protein
MTEKINQRNSQFDPDKSDLSSLSADELVRAITGIEAPTLKQKFEALNVLAKKPTKGDATVNLITDIISDLQTLNHSNDSNESARGKESAIKGMLAPLEMYANDPDHFEPEALRAFIEIAVSYYAMYDNFFVLQSQIDEAKSNPF